MNDLETESPTGVAGPTKFEGYLMYLIYEFDVFSMLYNISIPKIAVTAEVTTGRHSYKGIVCRVFYGDN